jgi:hypothetical protein
MSIVLIRRIGVSLQSDFAVALAPLAQGRLVPWRVTHERPRSVERTASVRRDDEALLGTTEQPRCDREHGESGDDEKEAEHNVIRCERDAADDARKEPTEQRDSGSLSVELHDRRA